MDKCPFVVGQEVECYTPPERWRTGEKSPVGGAGWKDKRIFIIGSITSCSKRYDHDLYILWPDDKHNQGVYHLYVRLYNVLPDELFQM